MCHTMIMLFDIHIVIKTHQQWFSMGSTHIYNDLFHNGVNIFVEYP